MSASALLGCLIAQGREDEARGVLRDYAAHLEQFGGSVTAHRVVFGGELQGRVLVSWNATTTAERASMLEQARLHGIADNPYLRAVNASEPALTTYSRILLRSVEPDLPPLAQAPLRFARVFSAAPGQRTAVEDGLRIARARAEEIGYQSMGSILEYAGPASDSYVYAVSLDGWEALEDFEQKNAARAPAPGGLIDLFASGAVTSVNRRIDYAFDLGRV